MIKIINKILIFFGILTIFFISYISLIGLETKRFNNQIKTNLKKIDSNIDIDLKQVKIILNPIEFDIKIKTLGSTIIYKKEKINLESIATSISVFDLLKNNFTSSNFRVSTKPIYIKDLVSLLRVIKKDLKFLVLEKMVDRGVLIANIEFELNQNGTLKNNYIIKGLIKDGGIKLLNKKEIKNIDLNFEVNNKSSKIRNLELSYDKIKFVSEKISITNFKDYFSIKGQIQNNLLFLSQKEIKELINLRNDLILDNLEFSSNNDFSFEIDKKIKLKNLKFKSSLNIKNLSINHNYKLKDYLPNSNEEINLKDHTLIFDYKENNFLIDGGGKIKIQNDLEEIKYFINKKKNDWFFETQLDLKKSPIIIDFLNFEKKDESELTLVFKGNYLKNKSYNISSISLRDESNIFELNNIILDKNFKIFSINSANFNYLDRNEEKNIFSLKKKSDDYKIIGKQLNAIKIIDDLLFEDSKGKNNYFSKNFNLIINIDKVLISKNEFINNLKGKLKLKNNEVTSAKLVSEFDTEDKLVFTIEFNDGKKITTFFSDRAKPFVKKFKFIKGFDEGSLDFYSVKSDGISNSKIKIYNFKLKELPLLTKILTLASLQGIADILSGEGIRFNELEMNIENKKNLIVINEIYAIGPAISILMDGYVEKKKLISLRGTLVPATTLNKVIGSIPFLGDILVGKKTGEGVFGVSFKIKGPPKSPQTTVNPIKTLTPRFITRTLEKIKKN